MSNQPELTKFRGAIFWDAAIENIDFTAHRGYVINYCCPVKLYR